MAPFTKDQFKYLAAIVIWMTTLLGASLPMCIKAPRWTARAESLAGGVFLGAGLAHLLAEAMEKVEGQFEYPVVPAVTLGVFVVLTLIELFSYSEHDADAFNEDLNNSRYTDNDISKLSQEISAENTGVPHRIEIFGRNNSGITTAMVSLFIIMDVHATIEGLALGIMSTWGGLIAILSAILGHKPVEAFAMALIILRDRPTKCTFWTFIALYTLLSPIGVIISIYISEFTSNIAVGIIGAISAGTFLFIGTHEWSEMLHHKGEWEFSEKAWHFLMFFVGIGWMLLIAVVETLSPEKD